VPQGGGAVKHTRMRQAAAGPAGPAGLEQRRGAACGGACAAERGRPPGLGAHGLPAHRPGGLAVWVRLQVRRPALACARCAPSCAVPGCAAPTAAGVPLITPLPASPVTRLLSQAFAVLCCGEQVPDAPSCCQTLVQSHETAPLLLPLRARTSLGVPPAGVRLRGDAALPP